MGRARLHYDIDEDYCVLSYTLSRKKEGSHVNDMVCAQSANVNPENGDELVRTGWMLKVLAEDRMEELANAA